MKIFNLILFIISGILFMVSSYLGELQSTIVWGVLSIWNYQAFAYEDLRQQL